MDKEKTTKEKADFLSENNRLNDLKKSNREKRWNSDQKSSTEKNILDSAKK